MKQLIEREKFDWMRKNVLVFAIVFLEWNKLPYLWTVRLTMEPPQICEPLAESMATCQGHEFLTATVPPTILSLTLTLPWLMLASICRNEEPRFGEMAGIPHPTRQYWFSSAPSSQSFSPLHHWAVVRHFVSLPGQRFWPAGHTGTRHAIRKPMAPTLESVLKTTVCESKWRNVSGWFHTTGPLFHHFIIWLFRFSSYVSFVLFNRDFLIFLTCIFSFFPIIFNQIFLDYCHCGGVVLRIAEAVRTMALDFETSLLGPSLPEKGAPTVTFNPFTNSVNVRVSYRASVAKVSASHWMPEPAGPVKR